ncbi:MAG TPA: glycosyltransferase family 4 protein [Candidatus Saccharimonadales bacterium]|nr:glycosyltransferase family 4 protein [Candidatus Saccharimonadales bacterium]
MKIGLVLDDTLDTPDGVQQYVLAIGTWLSSQGHDVHYLVGATTRTDIGNVHSLSRNFKVRFNGNRLSIPLPTSKNKLKLFLDEQNFDVLHIQMPYSPMLAQRIIKQAPEHTAIVGTFHVLPYSKMVHAANRALAVSLRPTLKMFDTIFTVSSAAQDFARKVYNIDSDVLPNVIDEARFRSAKPIEKFRDGNVTIVFLGRLVPRKGCLILLKAVNNIKKNYNLPEFKVNIGGKGPLMQKLKEFSAQHQLDDFVTFEGFISEDDKPNFLASADIAVFPSSGGESFGIVLLEAMAAGHAAVLAGDNPGYRSVMGAQPDLLFPALNDEILAKKLANFITDASTRKNIVNWQSDYVRQFDVNIVGIKLVNEYKASCDKRNK